MKTNVVDLTSPVWPTPVIPPQACCVQGVSKPNICLNETSKDGTWKFLFESPEGVPLPGADSQDFNFSVWANKNWQDVAVPGGLAMQGFDIGNNTEYYYQRKVDVPADYAGKRVIVRFDGVYTNTRVWVDGKYIRTHIGGFTTWDCDITDFVTPGAAFTLTVGVADIQGEETGTWNRDGRFMSDPSDGSRYAHHNMGGVNRDVALMALPGTYIARLQTNTVFDENFVDADLEITAQLGGEPSGGAVRLELIDPSGKTAAGEEIVITGGETVKAVLPVASPLKWDAEHPNLYTLKTTLTLGGKEACTVAKKIGFREISYGGMRGTDPNKLYINGKEVMLRGTCRHDVSYDLGRSTTKEHDWAEIKAFKEHNINFIRTSHYPASEHILDACDEYGVYVEQENATCFKGNWYMPDVGSPPDNFINAFAEMVERDRGRACVIIWSIGNESTWDGTPAFQMQYDYIKDVDRARPVIWSWPNVAHEPFDIYSQHYEVPPYVIARKDKPVLHDETAHIACYCVSDLKRDVNIRNFWGVSIKRLWEKFFNTDGCLGGALWGGVDEIFYLPEGVAERWRKNTETRVAGYGEWGSVLDVFMRLKPEAYLTKKAYSPMRIDEKTVAEVCDGKLTLPVKNWFDHTDLSELRLEYSIDGAESRTLTPPAIPPRGSGEITLDVPRGGKSVSLKCFTPDGIMVDEFNIRLAAAEYTPATACGPAPKIDESGYTLTVTGANFLVIFDKKTAQIKSASYNGKKMITGGPHLQLTKENRAAKTEYALEEWTAQSMTWGVDGDFAVVSLTGGYSGGPVVEFTLKIAGNGVIVAGYEIISLFGSVEGMSEIGIAFDIPGGAGSVTWLRDGLYNVYPRDHIGRDSGTAQKARANAAQIPDQYGVKPEWPWKDDMRNFFIYAETDPDDGIATNDFKTMRENIWRYDVDFPDAGRIRVEANADAAARVSVTAAGLRLIVNQRWAYPELLEKWANFCGQPVVLEKGTAGAVSMVLMG